MASVNKVILVGNLGRDPEVRYSQDGTKIVNMTLATSETWKDMQSGDRKEKTEWHRVVVFNDRLAEVAEKYLKKGSKVYVEGALQTRKWTGNDGAEKYTTEVVLQKFRGEIVMLDGKPDSHTDVSGNDGQNVSGNTPQGGTGTTLDDEIPFSPEYR